ncbi:MAG TPA: class I SAM-dependent methyltransferase, partial [Planctomycetota bacterium]|nr:class I SAM-dependent methyltransferase [Planctomycetota bacterium]
MYDKPLIYDIAFGYRDIPAEVDCLLAWAARSLGRAPASALELAAGPADHAIELASRGLAAGALDREASMCDYAREKAARRGVAVDVSCADMIDFDLGGRRFDLAATMLDSLCHVPTVPALERHLRAVARHLAPG